MHIWTYMLARLTVSLRDLATWTHDLPTWSETRFALVHLGGLCCDSRLCGTHECFGPGRPNGSPWTSWSGSWVGVLTRTNDPGSEPYFWYAYPTWSFNRIFCNGGCRQAMSYKGRSNGGDADNSDLYTYRGNFHAEHTALYVHLQAT